MALALLLAACGTAPKRGGYFEDDGPPQHMPVDPDKVPDAVPTNEPASRYGNKTYAVNGKTYHPVQSSRGYVERGVASWYGRKFHGNRTSNGEIYSMFEMSAAHRTLPLPSFVRVTNLKNGRSVVVRVNDRGPFWSDRLIDLSWVAARRIGVLDTGTALVEVRAVAAGERAPEPVSVASQPAPRLYLQVGAFASEHNATALQQRLSRDGFAPVVIQEFHSGVTTLHRVRIGPLATVAEGDELEARVTRYGIPNAQLVVD